VGRYERPYGPLSPAPTRLFRPSRRPSRLTLPPRSRQPLLFCSEDAFPDEAPHLSLVLSNWGLEPIPAEAVPRSVVCLPAFAEIRIDHAAERPLLAYFRATLFSSGPGIRHRFRTWLLWESPTNAVTKSNAYASPPPISRATSPACPFCAHFCRDDRRGTNHWGRRTFLTRDVGSSANALPRNEIRPPCSSPSEPPPEKSAVTSAFPVAFNGQSGTTYNVGPL